MKNFTGLLVTLLFVLTLSPIVYAQGVYENPSEGRDVSFGVRGGLTFYSVETEVSGGFFNVSETSDSKVGFAFGVFAEIPFTDIFSFQPEVLFVQKGGSDSGDFFDDDDFFENDTNGGTQKLTLNYLDVPLLGRANLPLQAEFTPYVLAGPSIGFLLSASVDDIDDDEIKDLFKSYNFGFIIGAGTEFGNLSVDLRYDIGLSNILDESYIEDELNGDDDFDDFFDGFLSNIEFSQKTSGIKLTVGYRF